MTIIYGTIRGMVVIMTIMATLLIGICAEEVISDGTDIMDCMTRSFMIGVILMATGITLTGAIIVIMTVGILLGMATGMAAVIILTMAVIMSVTGMITVLPVVEQARVEADIVAVSPEAGAERLL